MVLADSSMILIGDLKRAVYVSLLSKYDSQGCAAHGSASYCAVSHTHPWFVC